MTELNFDATVVEPSTGFVLVPDGRYEAVIIESDFKDTKSGTGRYLEIGFEIIEGDYKNQRLRHWLNLDNPNPTAVRIAESQLSAICRAVGVVKPKDSTELHDRPLLIDVCCRRRKDTGDMVNEIRGFKAKDDPSSVQPAAEPTGDCTPPWKRS